MEWPYWVALYTSAWIEIRAWVVLSQKDWRVALYTSAWIEMVKSREHKAAIAVALYTSAWIEIANGKAITVGTFTSHSTRVRGLK